MAAAPSRTRVDGPYRAQAAASKVAQGCPTDHHSHQHPRQPPTFTATRRETTGVSAPSTHQLDRAAAPFGSNRRVRRASLRTAESPAESIARCNRYGVRWRVGPRRSL